MRYTRTIRKNVNPENFLRIKSLKSFSGEYYNIENKILDFQLEPVCAKQTCPNYSVGNDQDEAQIQYDPWSTPRMVQLLKMWKDANQLKMHVLSQNSGS